MRPALESATWPGACTGCGSPFTDWGWDHRHDVNDLDAEIHTIDAGNYHNSCCPLPACATTTTSEGAA